MADHQRALFCFTRVHILSHPPFQHLIEVAKAYFIFILHIATDNFLQCLHATFSQGNTGGVHKQQRLWVLSNFLHVIKYS